MELRLLGGSDGVVSPVREFARLEADWCRGLVEPVEITGATVFSAAEHPGSVEGNSVANAWMPPGGTWAELSAGVDRIAAAPVRRWWTNRSMPSERTEQVEAGLMSLGWRRVSRPLLRWAGADAAPRSATGFTFVPARSALGPLADLAGRRGDPAIVAHLDDPQVDSWVALRSGRAVGAATVQISAQSAAIRDWFVEPEFRRRGVGGVLLDRLLDLCRRSEVKRLLAVCGDGSALAKAGFERVGEWVEFLRPE